MSTLNTFRGPEISITGADGTMLTTGEDSSANQGRYSAYSSPGHSRPGTPPPTHVCPYRESMTGLPPSPTHHCDRKRSPACHRDARSPTRLSCNLTKIASQESLEDIDSDVAFDQSRPEILAPVPAMSGNLLRSPQQFYGSSHSLQAGQQLAPINLSQCDSGYLVPNAPTGPGQVMPPSDSLNNLPVLVPSDSGRVTPIRGILKNCPVSPMSSTVTLNDVLDGRHSTIGDYVNKSVTTLRVGSTSNLQPNAAYFTPLGERGWSPCRLQYPEQAKSQSCLTVVAANDRTRSPINFNPQPSTSHQPSPCSFGSVPIKQQEQSFTDYSSAVRTTASGLLEDVNEPGYLDDFSLMQVHTPPDSAPNSPPPPPSPFATDDDDDAKPKKRSAFHFFRRNPNKKSDDTHTAEGAQCSYYHHTDEEIERTRQYNIAALSKFTLEGCECMKICPKLLGLLDIYKDYILRCYRAGPYVDGGALGVISTHVASNRELLEGRAFLLSVENIGERDWCLSVTFTQGCGINEQNLMRFSMYEGFKGFKVCGAEAFVIYTKEESAVQAMQSLNGLLFYLEHAVHVARTTPRYVKQVASSQTNQSYNRPNDMELAILYQRQTPEELRQTEEREEREERRRGGQRRRGDERYLPANRRVPRRTHHR